MKIHNAVVFTVVTELCDHHHNQFEDIFVNPRRNPILI